MTDDVKPLYDTLYSKNGVIIRAWTDFSNEYYKIEIRSHDIHGYWNVNQKELFSALVKVLTKNK